MLLFQLTKSINYKIIYKTKQCVSDIDDHNFILYSIFLCKIKKKFKNSFKLFLLKIFHLKIYFIFILIFIRFNQ